MTKTEVYATPEEVQLLKDLLDTPYIVAGGLSPLDPLKECHRLALRHGLPESPGYYGIDLGTGEFLRY